MKSQGSRVVGAALGGGPLTAPDNPQQANAPRIFSTEEMLARLQLECQMQVQARALTYVGAVATLERMDQDPELRKGREDLYLLCAQVKALGEEGKRQQVLDRFREDPSQRRWAWLRRVLAFFLPSLQRKQDKEDLAQAQFDLVQQIVQQSSAQSPSASPAPRKAG